MGRVEYYTIRIILIAVLVFCCINVVRNIATIPVEEYGYNYILDDTSDPYIKVLSDNVYITNINGLSNLYINLKNDGYSIYKEDINDKYIDTSFVKDGSPTYRIYYTYPEEKLYFFASPYEDSTIGYAYINRK